MDFIYNSEEAKRNRIKVGKKLQDGGFGKGKLSENEKLFIELYGYAEYKKFSLVLDYIIGEAMKEGIIPLISEYTILDYMKETE